MSSRRDHGSGTPSNVPSNRQNEYFIPRDGIDREVITADICRYLGNDALVRPGNYEDKKTSRVIQGYFVTAYRNLTSAMIADLKADSARWEQERRNHSGARYSDSQNRFSGAASSQYPGSDAPGYSASVGATYTDNRQSGYGGQYPSQAAFPSQTSDNRFATPGPAGASVYGTQPYPSHSTSAQAPPEPPYIGGHYMQSRQADYPETRMVDASSRAAYPAPGPGYGSSGQTYYSAAPHAQGAYPAQSGDPFLGRQSYPATTQADYAGSPSGQPIYQDQYEPQYENQTSPPPRAVASTSSSQAQTGNSASSHARRGDRERDRDADRHRRR